MPPRDKVGTLQATFRELKAGTFLGNARARSSRRKSSWNLLLLLALPLWFVVCFGGVRLARVAALAILHGRTVPDSLIWPSAIAPFFVYFPMMLASVPTAMVLINYAVYYLVPPARRAMDAEDVAYPGVEYATQQPLLLRISLLTLAVAFPLAVLGELFL